MSGKIIDNLNQEIESLMFKAFHLRKSIEKLERDLKSDDIEIEKLKRKIEN